jgi:hypothetical protein
MNEKEYKKIMKEQDCIMKKLRQKIRDSYLDLQTKILLIAILGSYSKLRRDLLWIQMKIKEGE